MSFLICEFIRGRRKLLGKGGGGGGAFYHQYKFEGAAILSGAVMGVLIRSIQAGAGWCTLAILV